MTSTRAGWLVLLLALSAYVNSLPNGFAYDDQAIITQNPVVTEGDFEKAALGPWWQTSRKGAGLYRPFTALSFTLEWRLSGGSPLAFHGGNVVVHAMVSLLLFLLLLELGSLPGALAGGALFAIHPLHTEAVANVVGRAELYSTLFFLLACLLYSRGRGWEGPARIGRLLALGLLYLLSLASKETGVTLPGILLILEAFHIQRAGGRLSSIPRNVWREVPLFLLLGVVLLTYLGLRLLALGSVTGEATAPVFEVVGPGARVLTAIALWAQYLRLLLFPLDLAADYDPGVFFPSEGVDAGVLGGVLVLGSLLFFLLRSWRRAPLVALGILWFGVCISPVSNFFFSIGTLLAERTLYLPSAGLSLVVAGLVPQTLALARGRRRLALILGVVVGILFFAKTVHRNPSWMSTFVVVQTLNDEHPESWRAFRGRAVGLERVGELGQAQEAWDVAVTLTPRNYNLLAEAGDFHARLGSWSRGREYMERAIAVAPELTNAYQLLSNHLLRREMGREGHRVALDGLARAGPDQRLWALLSESYLLKGDLLAASRARVAGLALDPAIPQEWERLGEIWDAMGEEERAREARVRAHELRVEDPMSEEETP